MIKVLQSINLYPVSCTWLCRRTRVLKYQNGYVKVLVERERHKKLINSLLYNSLKAKL